MEAFINASVHVILIYAGIFAVAVLFFIFIK
jgi:hypothetical protein